MDDITPARERDTARDNLGNIFAEHAASARIALVDLSQPGSPREFSYRAFDGLCDAAARGLVKFGLEPGDRIGVAALNRAEYLALFFGAMRAGVVPVPINIKLAAETVAFIARDAGVKLIFAEPAFRPLCPAGVPVIEFGPGFDGFLDPGAFTAIIPDPGSVALHPYTSGSTGRPKGVLLDHAGQLWCHRAGRWMRPERSYVIAAPLYHKNALMVTKSVLLAGAQAVLLARFDARQYLAAIQRYRPTTISGVPTMIAMLLHEREARGQTDISSVEEVSIGSAPASRRLLELIGETFANPRIVIQYGLTEGGPRMMGEHPAGLPRPFGSCGYPLAGGAVKLVGGAGAREGELWVKNPGVMLAYHNLTELTGEKLVDGWFKTGDVLRRDADGFYFFVGRTDDMFNSGGENIYPGEVEQLLERHPDVVQAAVIAVDHEMKGEVPHAFVVRRPGAALDEPGLKAFAIANGPAYQHPRRVIFLDALPLASTNKIDKAALKAML